MNLHIGSHCGNGSTHDSRRVRRSTRRITNKRELRQLVARASRAAGCPAGARAVLCALWAHCDGKHPYAPFTASHEQVLKVSCVSRATLKRALAALEAAAILVRVVVPGPRDRHTGRPCAYRFVPAPPMYGPEAPTDAQWAAMRAAVEPVEQPIGEAQNEPLCDPGSPASQTQPGEPGDCRTVTLGASDPDGGSIARPEDSKRRGPFPAVSMPLTPRHPASGHPPIARAIAPTASRSPERGTPSPVPPSPNLRPQLGKLPAKIPFPDVRPWRERTRTRRAEHPPTDPRARFAWSWRQSVARDPEGTVVDIAAHGPSCVCFDCFARRNRE